MTGLVRDARSPVYVLLTNSSTSSFLEFLPIMSILVRRYTPATLPYHIIIASLPGYTFCSPAPLHRDFRIEDIVAVVNTLMDLRFGSGYVAQGGDIGSKVSRALGAVHPEYKGKFTRIPFNTNCPLIESLDSRAQQAGTLSEGKYQIPNRNPAPVNFCIMPELEGVSPDSVNDLEKKGLVQASEFGRIGSAYALEHATRPSTIGLVLASHLLALLAW